MVKKMKYEVILEKDINGTYYVGATWKIGKFSELIMQPYSTNELIFRRKLDEIFPHLPLGKIQGRINKIGRELKISPIIRLY